MKRITLRRSTKFGVLTIGAIVFAGFLAACDPKVTPVSTSPAASPSPAVSGSPAASPAVIPVGSPGADAKPSAKVESMAGRWQGVEGTYLNIARKGAGYIIEVKSPDGVKTFEGTAKGDTIEFTRNGKTETIKSAAGAETGIKGLEKETNCLVITKGSDAYCKK